MVKKKQQEVKKRVVPNSLSLHHNRPFHSTIHQLSSMKLVWKMGFNRDLSNRASLDQVPEEQERWRRRRWREGKKIEAAASGGGGSSGGGSSGGSWKLRCPRRRIVKETAAGLKNRALIDRSTPHD
jgi:hypothetical protein